MIKTLNQPAQAWVAQLTELDPKYGFKRRFINSTKDKSTRPVSLLFELTDGFFEFADPNANKKGFFAINEGKEIPMTRQTIEAWFAEKAKGATSTNADTSTEHVPIESAKAVGASIADDERNKAIAEKAADDCPY